MAVFSGIPGRRLAAPGVTEVEIDFVVFLPGGLVGVLFVLVVFAAVGLGLAVLGYPVGIYPGFVVAVDLFVVGLVFAGLPGLMFLRTLVHLKFSIN